MVPMLHVRRAFFVALAPLLVACSGGGSDTSSGEGDTHGSGGAAHSSSSASGGGGGGATASSSASGASSTASSASGSSSSTSASSGSGTGGSAPVVLESEYILPDDQYPESGTYDPVQHAFFASSLKYGDVLKVDADGTQSFFYAGTGETDRVTLGMKVDATRRRLWVCSIINDSDKLGSIWVFDVDSGEQLADIHLDDTFSGASCNDLALDDQGLAYVTDRENPNVYRVDPSTQEVTLWATNSLLQPAVIGMNGIAFTPDHSALIVTKYLPARLIRISVQNPSSMSEVTLSGDSFSGGVKVANGADGIIFMGDNLYVAFGDNIMQVTPGDASWAAATVKAQSIGTGYTALTLAEGDLYAFRGQSVSFQFDLDPDLPFDILRVDPAGF